MEYDWAKVTHWVEKGEQGWQAITTNLPSDLPLNQEPSRDRNHLTHLMGSMAGIYPMRFPYWYTGYMRVITIQHQCFTMKGRGTQYIAPHSMKREMQLLSRIHTHCNNPPSFFSSSMSLPCLSSFCSTLPINWQKNDCWTGDSTDSVLLSLWVAGSVPSHQSTSQPFACSHSAP